VAVVAVAVLAMPTAAAANPAYWPSVSCADGALTAVARPGRNVALTGWIQPCPSSSIPGNASFTFAYYHADGGVAGAPLHYASDPAVPTHVERQVEMWRASPLPVAICLAFDPGRHGRVACSAIEIDPAGELAFAPLSTNDPSVAHALMAMARAGEENPKDSWPHCGTCV
jgi:hypothetical protein